MKSSFLFGFVLLVLCGSVQAGSESGEGSNVLQKKLMPIDWVFGLENLETAKQWAHLEEDEVIVGSKNLRFYQKNFAPEINFQYFRTVHGGLDYFKLKFLKKLKLFRELNFYKKCSETQKRVKVLDFGTGNGFMIWKMVAAGGRVIAVDGLQEAFQGIENSMDQASLFLGPDEEEQRVFHFMNNSDFEKKKQILSNYFNLVWSENVLNSLNPQEVEKYVEEIYEVLTPGGQVFLTAQVQPFAMASVYHQFKRCPEDHFFTGFSQQIGLISDTKHSFLSGDRLPYACESVPGFIMTPGKPEFFDVRMAKTVSHYFNARVLSCLFESMGFDIIETHYFSLKDKMTPLNLEDMDPIHEPFVVGIHAKKSVNLQSYESSSDESSSTHGLSSCSSESE